MQERGRLTIVRSDVFLHCTLGGFAPTSLDYPPYTTRRYHSVRLRRLIDRIARRRSRPGEVAMLAERFGRPIGSLRATITYRRRYFRGLDRMRRTG